MIGRNETSRWAASSAEARADPRERPALSSAVGGIVAAGATMAAGITFCVVVAPRPIPLGQGMSWFGVTRPTVLPYGVTLLATAALLLRASGALADLPHLLPVRRALVVNAVLLPALLATPYTLNTAVDDLHMAIGSTLFVVQLLAAGWLFRRTGDRVVGLLLGVQFAAGVVCAVSLPDLVEAMLQAQVVFQVVYVAALARGVLLLGQSRS